MGTKRLTITEEAYDRLEAHKREDETFTDVIVRLTGGDRDVMKGFGNWAGDGLGEAVAEREADLDEDFEARQDELF